MPPVSAAPHLDVVRPKLSLATTLLTGAVTVTDLVIVSVRPPLSVTVSFTEYVPAAA